MILRCRETVSQDEWAPHGHLEKPAPGRVARDFARFYFEDQSVAIRFADAFEGELQVG